MVLTSYISAQTATAIDTAIKRGALTRQLLTGVTVTFVRPNKDTGFPDNVAVNVALVSITLANRDPNETGVTQMATETRQFGTFEVMAPSPIRRGDRFTWNGALCQVLAVGMATHGVIRSEFELLKGVNG